MPWGGKKQKRETLHAEVFPAFAIHWTVALRCGQVTVIVADPLRESTCGSLLDPMPCLLVPCSSYWHGTRLLPAPAVLLP